MHSSARKARFVSIQGEFFDFGEEIDASSLALRCVLATIYVKDIHILYSVHSNRG